MQPVTNMNGLSRVTLQWEGAKYVVETTPAIYRKYRGPSKRSSKYEKEVLYFHFFEN
jgi:hypothetical protein